MGGLHSSRGGKKEVCVSAWAGRTRAEQGSGIKHQTEGSPRGEEMGSGERFVMYELENMALEGGVWDKEEQFLCRPCRLPHQVSRWALVWQLGNESRDSHQPIPHMWRWYASGQTWISLASHVTHVYRDIEGQCVWLQHSDCVYHGKDEKDILAGRQGAVEEILWCVIHAILEGQQSAGQARLNSVSHSWNVTGGWEHSFHLGPDQVSSISGMEWSGKRMAIFSWMWLADEAWVVEVLHLLWPFCYQLSGKHHSWSRDHWNDFSFSCILIQSSLFLFHPSGMSISNRIKSSWSIAVSFKQAIHCWALLVITALTCQLSWALHLVNKI